MTKKEIKKINKGCLFGLLSIPALAFISAILLSLVDNRPPLHLSVYFNALEYGINECLQRFKNGETTLFLDSTSFRNRSEKNFYNWRFKIVQSKSNKLGGNTCFAARAVPVHHKSDTWFEINYDLKSGKIIKICGDSKSFGCQENKIWTTSESLGPKGWN